MKSKRCSRCHINNRIIGKSWCKLCSYLYGLRRRGHSNERKPWSADDVELLKSATSLGISDNIIATDLKRTTRAVMVKRHNLGIHKTIKDFPSNAAARVEESYFGTLFRSLQNGYTVTEIADFAGIAKSGIYGACNKGGKMTLSSKAIHRIGEVMELPPDIINQLVSAHTLDKMEAKKRWIK